MIPISPTTDPEWAKVADEAVDFLGELIRIDTSNPPGNESRVADFLRERLAADGIEAVILEPSPGRGNLIARVRGAGSQGPLLLLSHTDVAPADPNGWRQPPFSGAVADGAVWGRGAIDMKHIVTANFLVAALAKRAGLSLQRDLLLVATADEESANESGAGWLWRTHPDLVQCEIALSEGGDSFSFRGRDYLLIATGQKGWVTIDLIRHSDARHSSIPVRENCLYEIGTVLDRLRQKRFPHRLGWTGKRFVEGLAAAPECAEDGRAILALLDPDSFDDALSKLEVDEQMRERLLGAFHSHATPTMVAGGQWTWAIPQQVSLRLAGRSLPEVTKDAWVSEFEAIVGPLGVCELSEFQPGIETRESRTFEMLADIVKRTTPDVTVLPTLSPGSDLQYPHKAGAQCYGFYPLLPEPDIPPIWELAHGPNERISIANLVRCVRQTWDAVCVLNGVAPSEAT